MKKLFFITSLFSVCVSSNSQTTDLEPLENVYQNPTVKPEEKILPKSTSDDLIELAMPERKIGGGYIGLGLGLAKVSLNAKTTREKKDTVNSLFLEHKKSTLQYNLSLITGFGNAFYKDYYIGIELDLSKKFKENTSENADKTFGVQHKANVGLNMDVRFGLLMPQSGLLVYSTVGFARVIGDFIINTNDMKEKHKFGSFYPTIGLGTEYKLNNSWNIRGDLRYAITAKDDKNLKQFTKNGEDVPVTNWECRAKPQQISFRISVTKNF